MYQILLKLSSEEAALLAAAMRASLASQSAIGTSDGFRLLCRKVLSAIENAKLLVEPESVG